MSRKQLALILGVCLLGVATRVLCLPGKAFFCDVPSNQLAVEMGTMLIQFPGYAPYHLFIMALASMTGSVFASLVLFNFACGILAMLFCVNLAGDRAGFHGAILASVVMGISVFPVYFSCAGASYASDMLAVSGMLFYGSRFLKGKTPGDYYRVLLWFIFGCMMRPLSCICVVMAIVYLLFKQFSIARAALTCAALLGGAGLYIVVSVPFYGSFDNFIAGSNSISAQLQGVSKVQLLTNLFRMIIYPIWGLHVFLVIAVVALWRSRRELDMEFCLFLLLLGGPYFCLLARYIPHAGYYCMILPVIVSLPWVGGKIRCLGAHPVLISAGLAVIFLCQIFVARPLPTSGKVSLVFNVCLFQYSYAGLKMGMFETLSSLAYKSGVSRDEIPENRIKDVSRLPQ